MPRLLINGFPLTNKACFHIRINSAAKNSGSQSKILYDKTIKPEDNIYELPLEKIYLGSSIRLEVTLPGFITIDKNIHIHTNKAFTSLFLQHQKEPNRELVTESYGCESWLTLNCKENYKKALEHFRDVVKNDKRLERNSFLAAMTLVLLFTAIIYLVVGPVGVLVVIIFAFYYQEKNKLNTWSDASK